jgi:hypothetical protein
VQRLTWAPFKDCSGQARDELMDRPSRTFLHRLELVLVVVVVLASLADAISTVIGLQHGAHELNVGAAALADRIGWMPVLILRVLPPAIGTFVLIRWASRDRVIFNAAVTAVVLVVVGWTIVVAGNATMVL